MKLQVFIKAVGITILYFIDYFSEHNLEYGETWPLTEREISILDANQGSLIDLLDLSILLDFLYSSNVISNRQRVFMSEEQKSHKRTETLLDILRRCSLHDYHQTICCLRQSNQNNIADVFESGGGRVK